MQRCRSALRCLSVLRAHIRRAPLYRRVVVQQGAEVARGVVTRAQGQPEAVADPAITFDTAAPASGGLELRSRSRSPSDTCSLDSTLSALLDVDEWANAPLTQPDAPSVHTGAASPSETAPRLTSPIIRVCHGASLSTAVRRAMAHLTAENMSAIGVSVDVETEAEELSDMHIAALYRPSQVGSDAQVPTSDTHLLGFAAHEIRELESCGQVAYIYQLQVKERRCHYGTQLVECVRNQCAGSNLSGSVVNVYEENHDALLFYAAVRPPFTRVEGSEYLQMKPVCTAMRWCSGGDLVSHAVIWRVASIIIGVM